MKELNRDDFLRLLREAGFKNKKEFAHFINTPYQSVNNWGCGNRIPPYLSALMDALIDSKKYKELVQGNNIIAENESLKQEISILQEKIKELESERDVEKRNLETLTKSFKIIKEYQEMI
ncbi:hypothetical protein [Helicobacter sp. MIT 05-5294]|uniref:hypothetical protein n=1 Tax=Helicobacter sp. MIT 05-5294 TaxID=1548150 RepID=UPI000AF39B68|nr:hypothetical protein [Helicobacter sp. MIT 05-5294]TLD85477.1 hypothetical protein LS69_009415 [Helicobacter sp. MIT 05-5294]